MTTHQEKMQCTVYPGLLRKSDVYTHRDYRTAYGRDPPSRPLIRLW